MSRDSEAMLNNTIAKVEEAAGPAPKSASEGTFMKKGRADASAGLQAAGQQQKVTSWQTGWFRDGCCNSDKNDRGVHTVCAKVTDKFLLWSKKVGNDLITPHPEFGFPGLKEGDCWCVCATWYARAIEEDAACSVYLKKTNIKTLELIPIEKLKKFAADLS